MPKTWTLVVAILMIIVGLIGAINSWVTRSSNTKEIFPYNLLVFIIVPMGVGIGNLAIFLSMIGIIIDKQVTTWCLIIIGAIQIALSGGIFFGLHTKKHEYRIYKSTIPLTTLVAGIAGIVLAIVMK